MGAVTGDSLGEAVAAVAGVLDPGEVRVTIDAATGRAWLALKSPGNAREYLASRIEDQDDAYPRDRLVAALDLVDIQRLEGDVTTALTTGESVLAATKNVSSPRLHHRLATIATTTFAQRTTAIL